MYLEGAVDRCEAEHLRSLKEAGRFAGAALATDESPPKEPRFRGLRFQITCFYLGTFLNLEEWESAQEPPILKTTMLADICHCLGKKGVDVAKVLEMQLTRIGLSHADIVSATGDGGPENEGSQGIHAHFEHLTPGYVRRRCLPHIAWRTCDQAIQAAGLSYRRLAAYLVDGGTWARLKDLAVLPIVAGGLGMMIRGSRRFKELFGQAPCAIIENRPETDLSFLRLLGGKEGDLGRLADKDLGERRLSVDYQAAVRCLADVRQRLRRRVLQEILERCMFLHRWAGAHPMTASEMGWDELLEKAVHCIGDLDIDESVLVNFDVSRDIVAAMDPIPRSWLELLVQQILGPNDLLDNYLPEIKVFHRRVVDQAAWAVGGRLVDQFSARLVASQPSNSCIRWTKCQPD